MSDKDITMANAAPDISTQDLDPDANSTPANSEGSSFDAPASSTRSRYVLFDHNQRSIRLTGLLVSHHLAKTSHCHHRHFFVKTSHHRCVTDHTTMRTVVGVAMQSKTSRGKASRHRFHVTDQNTMTTMQGKADRRKLGAVLDTRRTLSKYSVMLKLSC